MALAPQLKAPCRMLALSRLEKSGPAAPQRPVPDPPEGHPPSALAWPAQSGPPLHRPQQLAPAVEKDPAGVGARNLQECLLLQLEKKVTKTREVHFAIDVVKHYMDEFSKKHYDKIAKALEITDEEELKDIIAEITHLNPKPGGSSAGSTNAGSITPDFVIANSEGKLELSLNQRNMPELKLSKDYLEMLDT